MIISFSRTSEAFLAGVKTVSRRDWSERYAMQWVKAWEEGRTRHQAWNKVPRCKGAHQIGYFDLTACVYQERLADMSEEDVHADDWVKKGTSPYTARDKSMFETHWVENIHTGQRVEFKTKFVEKK